MPGQKRLIAAAAAALLLGLIVMFPARVAYQWFAPADFKLGGISGTVWNGNAVEGTASGIYFNDLKWRFRPLSLFAGRAAYSITADPVSGFIETRIAIRPGGNVSFSAFDAALSLAAFNGILPMRGVEGAVTLQFETVVLERGLPVEADGTLNISNLIVRDLSGSPLGNYRAVFQTGDNGISGQVADVSGALDIDGTIELRPDGSYTFAGQVAATAGTPSALVQQLQLFLGSPNAEGRHSFRIEGRL